MKVVLEDDLLQSIKKIKKCQEKYVQVITRLIYAFLQNLTVKKKFTENAKYSKYNIHDDI